MDDRPAFFRTLLHALYDFDFYRDVIPGGVRGALGYLVRLALLAAVAVAIMMVAYDRHYYRTVTVPKIETEVKPAFADAPALSWKDGILTADPTEPFKTSLEVRSEWFDPWAVGRGTNDVPPLLMTIAVDTRDKPDTRPILSGTGVRCVFTATHLFTATDQKDTVDQIAYEKQFDGMSFGAGEAYRFIFRRRPSFEFMGLAMQVVVSGLLLLLVSCAGSVIVGALGLMAVPEGRQFGITGVCSVAAHAMTPAAAVFLGVGALLLFTTRDLKGSPMWLLWAAPLAVAMLFTYLALKACTSEAPRPDRRKDEPSDDDLLPPDSV